MLDQIRASFREYFEDFDVELPEEIQSRGQFRKDGWSIVYALNKDEQGQPCLDFLAEHRMTTMKHVRILSDGRVLNLESFLETFSYDSNIPGDKERGEKAFQENNERVGKVLREKGLIK